MFAKINALKVPETTILANNYCKNCEKWIAGLFDNPRNISFKFRFLYYFKLSINIVE